MSTKTRLLMACLVVLVIGGGVAAYVLLSDESERSGFGPDAPDVQRLVTAMRRSDHAALYRLLAASATAGATQSKFVAQLAREERQTGQVQSVRMSQPRKRVRSKGGLRILLMEIKYARSGTHRFRAYFLFERGAWRLWTTKRIA